MIRSAFLRACLALAPTLAVAACGPALLPTDPARIPVGANGEFRKSAGPGPFSAVVIMHGCGGPPGHQEWIGRLNEWGYATYYIDSFTPRNLKRVCAEQQFGRRAGRLSRLRYRAAPAPRVPRPPSRVQRGGGAGFVRANESVLRAAAPGLSRTAPG